MSKTLPPPKLPDAFQDELDRIAGGRLVISAAETARAVGRTTPTVDDWIKRGLFPGWIQLTPGGPKTQRVATVRAWIEKRARARYQPPRARGKLKRGASQNTEAGRKGND